MTGSNPIVGQTPPSSGSNTNPAPSNELNANSFITLLTTQLQAQDPLNPLDPNQMVDELTTMNSFEQLLQIRQDLDTLVSATQPAQSSGTGANAVAQNGNSNANAIAAAFGAGEGSGTNSAAGSGSGAAASVPQISALSNALINKSLASMSSQLNSKSQLF
jgi:flagellar basal-body rod modification protein FlgD